jgi:hypothetical protein
MTFIIRCVAAGVAWLGLIAMTNIALVSGDVASLSIMLGN